MRTWRVGSISMGASLLFLGVLLLVSQLLDMNIATIFIAWWPVILIVLGIEILLFIYFSKKESSFVKYDFLSILFVGFIGTIAIGLMILSTTGILDKIYDWTSLESIVLDLPEYDEVITKDIKRVVVETGNTNLTIEDSPDNEVNVFGTYETMTVNKEPAIALLNDYLNYTQKGDTLYITFKNTYHLAEPFQEQVNVTATILIPANLPVEIEGDHNNLNIKIRNISENWTISRASHVNFSISDTANLQIIQDSDQDDDEDSNQDITTYGDGAHTISIIKSNGASFN